MKPDQLYLDWKKGLVQLLASLPNQRLDPTAAGHPLR
jgi:hypothetical protein